MVGTNHYTKREAAWQPEWAERLKMVIERNSGSGNRREFSTDLKLAEFMQIDNEIVLHIRLYFVFVVASGLSVAFAQQSNSNRVPDQVRFKSGYINPVAKPSDFSSAMLWGIAIADTRVHEWQNARVEIASTELSCMVDGKSVVLNSDQGDVRGGLYIRNPWFGEHNGSEPMSIEHDPVGRVAILRVGQKPDRIWHFWAASPRARIPEGKLEGCTVKMKAKISTGALLQIGMDYWKDTHSPFGAGRNNHEAGASNWYLPSDGWQQVEFTDIHQNP